VRLARSAEQPLARTARELGVSLETLRAWIKPADLDSGQRTDGLTSAEREELGRLRREVRSLRLEREILVKASAFFAREIERTP
jgi:transposase